MEASDLEKVPFTGSQSIQKIFFKVGGVNILSVL
nr:MAG TPA: hypothetical protein [Caudoviricetes sp.]